jgi:hypothetical protein
MQEFVVPRSIPIVFAMAPWSPDVVVGNLSVFVADFSDDRQA